MSNAITFFQLRRIEESSPKRDEFGILPHEKQINQRINADMSTPIKILIVEDTPEDLEMLERELRKSGLIFISTVVQTREDYEEQLQAFNPDLILSDYSLPSFDGVTAFHIRQKKHQDIPFIIVSGTIGEENAVELIKSGITDYAIKNKLFTVIPKINRALDEAKKQKEKKIADEKFRLQYEKLLEIAFLQSHQVRVPIANVMGLIDLIDFDHPENPENFDLIKKLELATLSFDALIHEIVKKTNDIERLK